MKRIFRILAVSALALQVWGCQYDDSKLWNTVDSMQERIEALEKAVSGINGDIDALKKLVDALKNQTSITSVTKTENGYRIDFSDGTSAEISNGKNGTNAPVISVKKDSDGLYYWTIDGEWMLIDGEKVPASGKDGAPGQDAVAPKIRINEETKEWEISSDGGKTWEQTGIMAEGKDGESLFKDVDTSNEEYVKFILQDGTELTVPRFDESAPKFTIEGISDVETITYGKTKEYKATAENVAEYSISKPDGWKVTYEDGKVTITAPAKENTFAETEGTIAFNLVSETNRSLIVKLNVKAADYELRILTFEDEDFKATPHTLSYCDVTVNKWSDLIDNPQYGGKMLYGDNKTAEYTWYDENNTFLQHIFPYNFQAYCYWGGGHAISNYVETDLKKGNFDNQLAVYFKDSATGNGGHNGSKNFCMHFGYKDGSPYNMTEFLPEIFFGDGQARVIDHMYVTNSTYAISCYMDGNGLTPSIKDGDWVKLVATGYDENGEKTASLEFSMVDGPEHIVKEWTKWDLSALGKVLKVEFNITGSSDNGYGYSQPAYFAYDDVAVRF